MGEMTRKKRRLLSIVLTIAFAASGIGLGMYFSAPALGSMQKRETYEKAVATLESTQLNEDGTYKVTEELVVALSNAEYTKPKNIILMIGDGMGFNILESTQEIYADMLYGETLSMRYLPVQSSQCTYSSLNQVTDSAAGATALSTGYKTTNSIVAMDWDGAKDYQSVLEIAAEKGKSTGVVATKDITDATPAGFTSHAVNRNYNDEIARKQMDKFIDGSLDLVLGGGSSRYDSVVNASKLAKVKEAGLTYVKDWSGATEASLPLAGLFESGNLTTASADIPTVAEMTDLALGLLSEDEDGFFLMVEGSQIDTYGHGNALANEMREAYQFDCAVAVAMKYVAMNPDTVLIVTADHETGGLQNEDGVFTYTTGDHTGVAVPVYAVGYGTDTFLGVNENTDVAILIAKLLGVSGFGYTSTVYDVLDVGKRADVSLFLDANADNADKKFITKKGSKIRVSFDEESDELTIPISKKSYDIESEENIRAFHISVTNLGEEVVQAPLMKVSCGNFEYGVEPQIDYIDAGETLILHYVLPNDCWLDRGIEDITDLTLYMNAARDNLQANIAISSIQMSGRVLGK